MRIFSVFILFHSTVKLIRLTKQKDKISLHEHKTQRYSIHFKAPCHWFRSRHPSVHCYAKSQRDKHQLMGNEIEVLWTSVWINIMHGTFTTCLHWEVDGFSGMEMSLALNPKLHSLRWLQLECTFSNCRPVSRTLTELKNLCHCVKTNSFKVN